MADFSHVFKQLDKCFNDTKQVSNYEMQVRCSSLPFCPRQYFIHHNVNFYIQDEHGFFGDACMEMGTALHTVTQRYLGLGDVLYGNWRCNTCKQLFRERRGSLLCCGVLTEYEEYDFEHPCGITGHPDGVILELPDGTPFRAIVEIKGNAEKRMSKMADPYWWHWLYQANFYLHAMNELKGLDLQYILMIYVCRGTPAIRKYFVKKPNKAVYDNTVRDIKTAKEQLHLNVLPDRICNSFKDGEDLECPYRYICFLDDDKLRRQFGPKPEEDPQCSEQISPIIL